ncbi:MAG: hypothetical protein ABIL22_07945 [candidate division WOR-3 bacterium]
MIFYNDTPELLEECLVSLKKVVDRIVAVDGAYIEFPHYKPYSTDGCLDIAKKYADVVIENKDAWPDQISKRNAYLTLSSESDYYFVLDADEVVEGKIDKHKLIEPYYGIKTLDCQSDGSTIPVDRIRLIRHQRNIQYRNLHCEIWANNFPLINSFTTKFTVIDGVIIKHHTYRRPKNRLENDAKYMTVREENNSRNSSEFLTNFEYDGKVCLVKFVGKEYRGDDLGRNIILKTGQMALLTREKAHDLLSAYKKDFILINEFQDTKHVIGVI